MRKLLKKGLSVGLCLTTFVGMTMMNTGSVLAVQNLDVVCSEATNKDFFAHNIYLNPDLSNTSRKFSYFMIDFKSNITPLQSYWSLYNASLNIDEIKKEYPNAQGGGFYGGLMYTGDGKREIFSFWDITNGSSTDNRTNVITTPTRVYPYGNDNTFGGEGNGHNYADNYEWQADKWYTGLIHCWKDIETDRTFIGQWFRDNETGKWTLSTYYDTTMNNTYIEGALSQFMENFSTSTSSENRNVYWKNLYAYDLGKENWISLDKATISYSYTQDNKYGMHEIQVYDDYFYGTAGGYVDNQEEYDRASKKVLYGAINQPSTPTLGEFKLDSVKISDNKLSWETKADSTPMAEYCIDVLNESDMIVKTHQGNRPEKTSITTDTTFKDGNYRIRLTFKDLFGSGKSYNYAVNVKNGRAEVSKRDILMGDIDSNGSVGLSDVVALMRGTVSSNSFTEYQRKVGDINGDNTVSLKDAVLLQKWLLGVQGNYNIGHKIDIVSGVEVTEAPTQKPTEKPTQAPTQKPTEKPTQAPTTVSSTQKVQFTNAQNWSNVYVYAWNSQTLKANASWPGVQMKYESTNSMGQSIYALDISKNFDRVIFTTASGSPQTQDVVWNNTVQQGYWVTSKTTTNSYGTAVYIVQPWGKDENGKDI